MFNQELPIKLRKTHPMAKKKVTKKKTTKRTAKRAGMGKTAVSTEKITRTQVAYNVFGIKSKAACGDKVQAAFHILPNGSVELGYVSSYYPRTVQDAADNLRACLTNTERLALIKYLETVPPKPTD